MAEDLYGSFFLHKYFKIYLLKYNILLNTEFDPESRWLYNMPTTV